MTVQSATVCRSRLLAIALGAALSGLAAGAAQAQDSTATPLVLGAPGSVRAVGLNDASVALLGDAGAVFANPTGMATISHVALEGTARATPDRGYLTTGALAWRVRQFDLGIGGKLFNLGDQPARYLPGSTATRVEELLSVGSLVYRYGLVAAGVSAKYARRKVDATYQRAVSADAGVAVAFFDIMAIAFGVQNVGGNWNRSSPLAMPRRTRLGFTMNYTDPQETLRLLSTVEIQWPEGQESRVLLGGEAGVAVKGIGIVGRVGYATAPQPFVRSHISLGASVYVSALKLDYAYREADVLDMRAHYFGLRLTL